MITKIFFLFQIVSSGQIRVWMVETVRGEVELAGEAVELYFHVGLDCVRVEGDGEHGDVGDDLPCVC